MTPVQALELLDQAASLAPLNRQQHFAIQQALEVVKKALEEKKDGKADKGASR
jgi:hypothetical protein